jgi:hypothetical protein
MFVSSSPQDDSVHRLPAGPANRVSQRSEPGNALLWLRSSLWCKCGRGGGNSTICFSSFVRFLGQMFGIWEFGSIGMHPAECGIRFWRLLLCAATLEGVLYTPSDSRHPFTIIVLFTPDSWLWPCPPHLAGDTNLTSRYHTRCPLRSTLIGRSSSPCPCHHSGPRSRRDEFTLCHLEVWCWLQQENA